MQDMEQNIRPVPPVPEGQEEEEEGAMELMMAATWTVVLVVAAFSFLVVGVWEPTTCV